jgi:hypothetical protein
MANMLGESTDLLLKSLAELIGKGEIRNARINCRTLTLERQETEEKARLLKTEQRLQKLQDTVLNNAYASIVRLAILEHEQPGEHRGAANPEDVLADVDDSDNDDDVDMVYDNIANPDDGT